MKGKRGEKRNRDLKYKRHLKRLEENCSGYPSPVMAVDRYGNSVWKWNSILFPDEIPREVAYYKRLYRGKRKTSASRFFKKYSNKVVRRYKNEVHKGCAYKKLFDYWWTIC